MHGLYQPSSIKLICENYTLAYTTYTNVKTPSLAALLNAQLMACMDFDLSMLSALLPNVMGGRGGGIVRCKLGDRSRKKRRRRRRTRQT